jgi:ABC-type transporter Mla MlaB component
MTIETGEVPRICLDGDWSMNGVAETFPGLTKFLAGITGTEASAEFQKCPPDFIQEMDLTGITDFDACGCQLLALFVRRLKENGVSIHLIKMNDALRSKIHFLGFGRELNLSF